MRVARQITAMCAQSLWAAALNATWESPTSVQSQQHRVLMQSVALGPSRRSLRITTVMFVRREYEFSLGKPRLWAWNMKALKVRKYSLMYTQCVAWRSSFLDTSSNTENLLGTCLNHVSGINFRFTSFVSWSPVGTSEDIGTLPSKSQNLQTCKNLSF